ncbi:MAG: phosphatase PAP2 family protein [Atopobiaceae bacterium]|jgi:undecaprenyl-diphosphatase|nr:phosphatase PAP2 family protein [Atopobiaceae bacterium]MCH4181480.1 phosphatase PAP2 family protein [Atopobiaceae bacterium]MCH4214838.1 phosphatase PAP2 family protein [Atopobiaceae bacterium]MCH4230084.1 phosphatase PAP2 family protein [Atopobiaceae bacterium]MCH4276960.1 phosphatase PAP2 family protein [Atopobiaceae bacterium]
MAEPTNDGRGPREVHGIASSIAVLLRKNVRTVVAAVCVVVFVWLLSELAEGELTRIDSLAYSFFVAYIRSDTLTPIMEEFTSLATPVVLLAMLVVVAAFAPGRRPGWCAMVNLVLIVVINQLLKAIVQRPRPEGFRLVDETGYSFPSGHSMVAMAFYGLLAWYVWHYERDAVMRWFWCICLGALVVMVGVSRIYLGVHYATDVIAGFCVSLAWLAFYTKVICPVFLPEPGRKELAERDG